MKKEIVVDPLIEEILHEEYSTFSDSTSIMEIITILNGEPLDEADAGVTDFLGRVDAGSATEDEGLRLIRLFSKKLHMTHAKGQALICRVALLVGALCIALKKIVNRPGLLWDGWATENIPGISQRNRQKYMRCAACADAADFCFLGIDRLDHLCSVIPEHKNPRAIFEFCSKHGLNFDPEAEQNLDDFKLKVDAAINAERLLKHGVTLRAEALEDLTAKKWIKAETIGNLVDMQKAGADVNNFVEDLILRDYVPTVAENQQKTIADFNSAALTLTKVIDRVFDSDGSIAHIDVTTLRKLDEKLALLKERARI